MYRAILLLLVTINIACNTQHKSSETRSVFRYNESKGIATLDPAYAKDNTVIWPVNQLFNGLIELDDSLHIKPCIAKSWTITDKGKTYTFTLRNDVYFHNDSLFAGGKGRKVIASDFVYSFLRILETKTASPGYSIFKNIETPYSEKGFIALNDTVLQIHLKQPFASFLGLLTMPYCFVVPHEIVDAYGTDFRSHPIGTGPFYFKTWREGEKLIFRKNPNYFEKDSDGNRLPYIDAIAITFISDKQSEFLEFIKGNIDFLSGVNAAYKDEMITRSGKLNPKYKERFVLEIMPYLNTEYLTIMLDSSILPQNVLRNKYLRLAINHGIDRAKMVKYLRNNLCLPAYRGIIPTGLPGYSDDGYQYTFSPDLAAEYLKKAGYPQGKGLQPITITTTSDYLDLCEFIQHELEKLGIVLNIEVSQLATFKQNKANARLAFFRSSWIADYPDAENYLSLFYSKNFAPNGPNYSHYKNLTFDNLYTSSISETNTNKRINLYQQMNEMLVEDAVIIPLYYDRIVRIYPLYLQNFKGNPLNVLKLKNVRIKHEN